MSEYAFSTTEHILMKINALMPMYKHYFNGQVVKCKNHKCEVQ